MTLLPLTRTCRLSDFADCPPAVWQTRFVDTAYQRWMPSPLQAPHLLLNLSGSDVTPLPEIAQDVRPFTSAAAFLRYLAPIEVASIVALMVVDRVEAPLAFLKHVAHQLRPGGLLVLTFAYWDSEGEDVAIGHELRLRIYNRISWRKLAIEAERFDLHLFGGCDWTYHGHVLGDHTLATLVLTKGSAR